MNNPISSRKIVLALCWLSWFTLICLIEPIHSISNVLVNAFSYGLVVTSIITVIFRSGFMSVAFWVVFVAAAPLLAPLITVDILGFEYFNTRAVWLQDPDKYVKPLLFGSSVVLYLSLALDDSSASSKEHSPFILDRHELELPWTVYIVLFATGCLSLGSAVLADPHLQVIGQASYNEIHSQQSQSFAFAGAAYLVLSFAALVLHFDIMDLESDKNIRRVGAFIFWFFLITSTLWLLSKGNRSEAAGVLLVLFLVYSTKIAI